MTDNFFFIRDLLFTYYQNYGKRLKKIRERKQYTKS